MTETQQALTADERAEKYNRANKAIQDAYAQLVKSGAILTSNPTGCVQWVHIDRVKANDYNPNAVAKSEMALLHTSISEDGYTQPVVTIRDEDDDSYIVVDGYHRYTTMRMYPDIAETTGGYLPIVVIDKPLADRIASTVRHNRARGKHSTEGMSNLVFQMLKEGEPDATICRKLGLEAEELARLKHTTGYSKLYAGHKYSAATQSTAQVKAKAEYKKENPNESIPQF